MFLDWIFQMTTWWNQRMKRDWVKKFILEEKSEVEGAHILRKVHYLFPFIPLLDIFM